MRRLLALAAALAALAATVGAPAALAGGGTAEKLWTSAKTHVTLVMGTSDYAPGTVRVSFLVIDKEGRSITAPGARLSLARGLKEAPFTTGTATLEPTLPAGHKVESGDVGELFVGHITAPAPGTYWLVAQLDGKDVAGLGNVIVAAKPAAPVVGAAAYPSKTPTLATQKDIAKLTTRTPPDRELLRTSIAGALAAHQPFVVVFATPKFCSSRTCGPVVDVVDAVRARWAGTTVQFIHVEIYTDNVPSKGPNTWVKQWNLPTEPWTFIVGTDGRIKARFEGSLSVAELSQAVQTTLGIAPGKR